MQQHNNIVHLAKVVPDKTFVYNRNNLHAINTNEALRNALSYRMPQRFIDPHLQLFIICVPAYEITEGPSEGTLFDGNAYIKVSPTDICPHEPGIQSGKRSALFNYNGELYRLKGCGNLDEGFPLQAMPYEVPGFQEIRGCCYIHTVKRELYINAKVEDILQQAGIPSGNVSVGYWQYGDVTTLNATLEKPLVNSVDLVPKYCGIFKTKGDQRLGTHLLQGLSLITSTYCQSYTLEQLRYLITKVERIEQYPDEKEDGSWHLSSTRFHERDYEFLQQMTVPLKVQARTDQIFEWSLENNLNSRPLLKGFDQTLYLMSVLYERLGYEVGRIKRIFIDNDLNWGYFRDHSLYQYHCNAHLDNFIVVKGDNLLAPCDFDLSFFKEEFITIEYDISYEQTNQKAIDLLRKSESIERLKFTEDQSVNPLYGKFDGKLWEWQLEMERVSIELQIAGVDMIMNSASFAESGNKSKVAEVIEVLMRDQMRIGYLNGFQLLADTSEFTAQENILKLLDDALMKTQHIVS